MPTEPITHLQRAQRPGALKVLAVDDSALMRRWLKQCMEEIGATVELARNGRDALAKIPDFQPDVITLDINMPEMDGLTCLSHIMSKHPCPVVMLSSIASKGALVTLEALEMGAVDYFEKPGGTVSHRLREDFGEIQAKVKAAATAKLPVLASVQAARGAPTPKKPVPSKSTARRSNVKLVIFGVSTGGPGTIETVLADVSPDLSVPVLIAVHMPNRFVQPFAERLENRLELSVAPLDRSAKMLPGMIVVAGADSDVIISERQGIPIARQAPIDPNRVWHPSIDRVVETAMNSFRADELVGVQLTGMGDDGASGMAELKRRGGYTIAEAEETAVIFGMPRELIVREGANDVLPNHKIGGALTALVGTKR